MLILKVMVLKRRSFKNVDRNIVGLELLRTFSHLRRASGEECGLRITAAQSMYNVIKQQQ